MQSVLVNGRILTPEGIVDGKAVTIRDGRIAALLAPADTPAEAARHDLDGGLLVPGFIDTQVNGGGGVLFNDSTTVEAIAAIGAAHPVFEQILMIQSFYLMANSLSVARGYDPESPPHLNNVTETV